MINLIPNGPDDEHCLQCCYAMINNAIFDEKMSAVEAEKYTNYKKGIPTWQFQALVSFALKGLKVKDIENFSIDSFIEDPKEAVRNQFKDPKVVEYILNVTDFENEVKIIKEGLKTGNLHFEERVPTIDDIRNNLKKGNYCFCNVNYWLLEGDSDKYSGHFVVIEEFNEDYLILQNPGLPPKENQKVSLENFMNAWYYPNEDAANLYTVEVIK